MLACLDGCLHIVNRNVLGDENSKNLPGLLCFQVDDLLLENNCLTLKGFTFRYDYKISEPEIKLKTKNTEIKMDVIYGIKRNDVNAFFVCKHDYSKTGFIASAVIDPDKEYEIIVSFGWLRDIPTDVYITGTNIHYVPDVAFIQPLSEGTALEPIVKNGYPRVFRSDYPFWVYQYKEALYWIADKSFCFEEDGSTYIQYQLWTTQPENLPKERLDNGWYWDNIGGNFEDYEITEMINCGQYRVMKRDLPAAYPITSILTGYYKNGKWIWQDYFRPVYNFE